MNHQATRMPEDTTKPPVTDLFKHVITITLSLLVITTIIKPRNTSDDHEYNWYHSLEYSLHTEPTKIKCEHYTILYLNNFIQ